jgi:hypothetical protein
MRSVLFLLARSASNSMARMAKMLNWALLNNKINYIWRVAATGFSFASFGIGGVAIATVVAPLVI